ncbi:hypothetical protein [Methylotuvimicrobium buryatense]|nr:hypothetical protein [Methylotuvimicrobium buryatense]
MKNNVGSDPKHPSAFICRGDDSFFMIVTLKVMLGDAQNTFICSGDTASS